ncbi:hypothetical protein [Sphingomonas koreensis]
MIVLAAGHERYPNIKEAAAAILAAIGASSTKERESSHYAEGSYFRGDLDGVDVRVSRDSDYDELPLWIVLDASDEDIVANTLASLVAGLKSDGFRLARIENFGRNDEWLAEL